MAHEDIHVSQQWRDRILDELARTQIFIPLLSAAFKHSDWASQEVGLAMSRSDVLIIPVSLDGTVPYGFIGALQGRRLRQPITGDFFREAIGNRFPREVIARLIDTLAGSGGWRTAESNFRSLLPFLGQLTTEEAEKIAVASTQNSQIWDAGGCRSAYIPAFLETNRHQLAAELLRPLEYQIEHGKWYDGLANTG